MPYLHKAEKWRHPETKERAVVWPFVQGCDTPCATIDFYSYKKKYSYKTGEYPTLQEARLALEELGFKQRK